MSGLDRSLIVVGSLVVVALWGLGWSQAAADADRDAGARGPLYTSPLLGPLEGPAGPGGGAAASGFGANIDPITGMLVGVVPPDLPGIAPVTWERLKSYEYQPDLAGLPKEIADLDGQKVVMIGFLMTVFEYDDIHEFHLVASHWSCCYGVPPGLSGAVYVKMPESAQGLPNTIKPLRVVGTLQVEEIKESGFVYAIYAIRDAEVVVLDY